MVDKSQGRNTAGFLDSTQTHVRVRAAFRLTERADVSSKEFTKNVLSNSFISLSVTKLPMMLNSLGNVSASVSWMDSSLRL